MWGFKNVIRNETKVTKADVISIIERLLTNDNCNDESAKCYILNC